MPDVTPSTPDIEQPFGSEAEHIRAHRALERGVEALGTGIAGTASTAAPLKGIYRTAAVVGTAVGYIDTNSVYVATFSVETQVGNAIQPGDPVMVVSGAALPTNAFQLGNGQCTATNTIVVAFLARAGGINTTTVSFHVFTFDIT